MILARRLLVVAFAALMLVPAGARADGSWSGAGTLTFPRSLHTVHALPGGGAVAIGGRGCPPAANLLSASYGVEIYDPATRTWRLGATPAAPRDRHTTTVLADGRILMAGGQVTAGVCQARLHVPMAMAEVYDPANDTWERSGSLAATRTGHSATLLADGRVLVAGGTTSPALEVWSSGTGTWARAGDLILPRSAHSATLLADGSVLIAGGNNGGFAFPVAELFDPATGISVPAGEMLEARSGHQAIAMPDGTVLAIGGIGSDGTVLRSVESYDPDTDTWRALAPTLSSRAFHTATLMADGRVLIVGGSSSEGIPLTRVEIYDPALGGPVTAPPTQAAHTSHAAVRLTDGSILVVAGGYEGAGFTGAAERYQP